MLTLHVRSRVFPQLEDAAQFIKAIIGMYDVFMENKRIKAAQAVANLVEVDSTAAAAAVVAQTAAMEADVQVSYVVCPSTLLLSLPNVASVSCTACSQLLTVSPMCWGMPVNNMLHDAQKKT